MSSKVLPPLYFPIENSPVDVEIKGRTVKRLLARPSKIDDNQDLSLELVDCRTKKKNGQRIKIKAWRIRELLQKAL